jgi:hypothetical protein
MCQGTGQVLHTPRSAHRCRQVLQGPIQVSFARHHSRALSVAVLPADRLGFYLRLLQKKKKHYHEQSAQWGAVIYNYQQDISAAKVRIVHSPRRLRILRHISACPHAFFPFAAPAATGSGSCWLHPGSLSGNQEEGPHPRGAGRLPSVWPQGLRGEQDRGRREAPVLQMRVRTFAGACRLMHCVLVLVLTGLMRCAGVLLMVQCLPGLMT